MSLLHPRLEIVTEKHKGLPKPPEFHGFLGNKSGDIYDESVFVIDLLVEHFGKTKLLRFIKSLKNKDFDKEFENNYNLNLSYKEINRLLKEKRT